MPTVRFRGTRADVTRIALDMAAALAGKGPDTHGVARGFQLTLGFAALSDIKAAYVVKAAGGTDEMGIRWPKLSPVTIANRKKRDVKVSPAVKKRRDKALRAAQQKLRKEVTQSALLRFRLSLSEAEAQRRAKALGAQITVSATSLEILRDTGVLLNSLGPGRLTGRGGSTSYSPPTGKGSDRHIFTTGAGEVIVGTNVVYAATHQHGDPSRNIPARPFLPDGNHPVPAVWWDRWVKLGNKALVAGLEVVYRGAA